MRAGLVIVLLLLACKGNDKREAKDKLAPEIIVTRTEVPDSCKAAITRLADAPLDARPKLLLDSCRVCGDGIDWTPLLQWDRDPASGGPRPEQIEQLMVACGAFCTGDSKLKFMAGIDKARGQGVNTPWRKLATACKANVNGSADDRFMSAPYFALDRIGRAVALAAPAVADTLATVELPLPALTVSGAGVALPEADEVTPTTGTLAITVIGDAIHLGRMPRAHLGAAGVIVDLPAPGYPGEQVNLDQLAAKLTKLVGGDATQTITVLAPQAMPAKNLVPIIAAAAPVAPIHLAASAHEAPEGWQLAGTIPVALEAGKDIQVTDEMTVQNLARDLAARAARKQQHVGVTKR